jgi:hypothetical protein
VYFPELVRRLLKITHMIISRKVFYSFTSPGERRAVTPAGIARVRRPRRVVFSRRAEAMPAERSANSDSGRRYKDKFLVINKQLITKDHHHFFFVFL